MITLVADTNRHVVPDPAAGIDATQSRARILAFSGDASQLLRAVRVDHTLRAAIGRRADHLRHASAPTLTTNIPWWQCVWSTRIGIARVFFNNRLNGCKLCYKKRKSN